MRQTSQSVDDAKFRTALENMRYKACTPDDIDFLCTRVAGKEAGKPKISNKDFRNVAIITAYNAHKDKLNELGTARFATETGQELVDFFSVDTLSHASTKNEAPPNVRAQRIYDANRIPSNVHKELWNLPPAATSHIPGKLSLCIGLPVMIRNNDATELCITKGQEGRVTGWISNIGPQSQCILETVFVRLDNPPTQVQFEGLPENVVPLTPSSKPAKAWLSDDTVLKINRCQVNLLPNFGMTDFASQGKTRPYNPVDLNNCKDHQSIYTCLSRSSTASGTIIVQGFDSDKITGGMSGYLRQEYRELELLDEITKLKYEGVIPDSANINGHRRNIIIRQYREWKGENHVPPLLHPAIKWSQSNPFPLTPIINDSKWELIEKDTKSKEIKGPKYVDRSQFVPAQDARVSENKKRKVKDIDDDLYTPNKKLKKGFNPDVPCKSPVGMIWDSSNYSCAYDSLFTILYQVWLLDMQKWTVFFNGVSTYSNTLASGFKMYTYDRLSLEDARDNVRYILNTDNPNIFPNGPVGIGIDDLARSMFYVDEPLTSSSKKCMDCNFSMTSKHVVNYYIDLQMSSLNIQASDTLTQILSRLLSRPSSTKCPECSGIMEINTIFKKAPPIIVIYAPYAKFKIVKKIKFQSNKSTMNLKGVVYYGQNHYTSRIIDTSGNIWFHDGMNTRNQSELQDTMKNVKSSFWNKCKNQKVALLIYTS
jgi:hypothetical protein